MVSSLSSQAKTAAARSSTTAVSAKKTGASFEDAHSRSKHDAALILRKEGWSEEKIGKALSVSEHAVENWRRHNGIEAMRDFSRKFDTEQALKMYHAGASDAEIAKAFGGGVSGAWHWRQRHGLEANPWQNENGLKPDAVRKAKALLRQGASLRQVAEAVDRKSIRSVQKLRQKMAGEASLRKHGHTVWSGQLRTLKQDSAELYRRILRALGTGISADIRADAANDMYVAMLEDRLKPEQIERKAPRFVNKVLSNFASKFGPLSIDMRDEDGFSIGDRLVDDSALTDVESAGDRALGYE